MKIPKNMSEQETIDTINTVINRISPKYVFKDYDLDDIKQESFIICVDALNRYDGKRSLENFLSVHLSNRLKNFIRDNHYVKDNIHKKKIKAPSYIIDDNYINQDYDLEEEMIKNEMVHKIDLNLPAKFRDDYLKILNNLPVPKQRKEKVYNAIKEIFKNEER